MKITPKQTLDEVKKAAFRELKQDMTDVLDGLARIDGRSTSAVVNNAPATKVTSNPKDVFVTTRFVEDGFHGSVATPENFQVMTRPEYSDVQLAARGKNERGVDQFLTENSANLTFSNSAQTLVTSDSTAPQYDLSDTALANLWNDMVQENSRSDTVVAQESRQHNAWMNQVKNAFGELGDFVRNLRKEESVASNTETFAVVAAPVEPKAKEVLPTIVAEAPKAPIAPSIVVEKAETVVVEKPAVVVEADKPTTSTGSLLLDMINKANGKGLAGAIFAQEDTVGATLNDATANVHGVDTGSAPLTVGSRKGLGEGTSSADAEIGELAKAEGGTTKMSESFEVLSDGSTTANAAGFVFPDFSGKRIVAKGLAKKERVNIPYESGPQPFDVWTLPQARDGVQNIGVPSSMSGTIAVLIDVNNFPLYRESLNEAATGGPTLKGTQARFKVQVEMETDTPPSLTGGQEIAEGKYVIFIKLPPASGNKSLKIAVAGKKEDNSVAVYELQPKGANTSTVASR